MVKWLLLLIYSFVLISTLIGQVNEAGGDINLISKNINYYISHAKMDSAKIYTQSKIEDGSNRDHLGELHYQLVKVLFIQSEYDEALKKAFFAIDNFNLETELEVKFNFMVGCIYSAIKDYGKSVEYYDLVVNESQDTSLSVQTYLLLSQLHIENGDSLKAGEILTAAYGLALPSSLDSKIKNHVAMQYNYFKDKYEICKQLNKDIIDDTTSFAASKSYAYSMIGDCLMKQDSLEEAVTYYNEFLKFTVETKDPEQIKISASKLIEVYEKLGNQDKANGYHKIYNEAVSDSLSFSVEKYRDLYNIEKNREQILAASKKLRDNILFAIGLLLLGSFGLFKYLGKGSKLNGPSELVEKAPVKKIVINNVELKKIKEAINKLVESQAFLTPKISRKSFCHDYSIKSERYLSEYINTAYEKSFPVFINDLRTEYAYNRIRNDEQFRNYRVEEIAKSSGFGSKKSFERAFVSKYKETPYKFIARLIA